MSSVIARNVGFDAARSSAAEVIHARADRAGADEPETGPFHGLFQKNNALERLVADAGPLGKFKTDQPDQMPSGTSAMTMRIGDALNRIAARLGTPVERILSTNPSFTPAAPQRAIAELPPGHGATAAPPDQQIHSPRPAIASEAENRVSAEMRGNSGLGKA